MRRRFSATAIGIALSIAVIASVGYIYAPPRNPQSEHTTEPAPGCNLHKQTCTAELPDGGRIEFSITPHPIPVAKPIQINATVSGVTPQKVEIDFSGVKMDMGINRTTLATPNNKHFTGTTMLPVCSHGRMSWRATLVIETADRHLTIPFLFEAPEEDNQMRKDTAHNHPQGMP